MTLDPQARSSWRDMMGFLRPPTGFRLEAAVGTTFGMGFDALVASLLAMLGADGEGLDEDPLAALISATRLAPRTRILVHAGTVSGSSTGVPKHVACLLDRVVVSVKPAVGFYHPKLWVVRYRAQHGKKNDQKDRVRVLVGSRNLTSSSCFELGAVLEGEAEDRANDFGIAVSRVLAENLRLGRFRCPPVSDLVDTLRRTPFRLPDVGREITTLHWQGPGGKRHYSLLPEKVDRALVLSPFLGANFVREILERASNVRIVSTPDAFRRLDEDTFMALERRATEQNAPSMYAVTEAIEKVDEGTIDGLHAKAVLLDEGKDVNAVTFMGSANATDAGWAVKKGGNAESLIELRPGLGIDQVLRDFVFDKRGQPRPWIREYQWDDRTAVTPEEELEDKLRTALRDAAGSAFSVAYSREERTLTLGLQAGVPATSFKVDGEKLAIECLPFALHDQERSWADLTDMSRAPVAFSEVELCDVTAFVLLRTSVNGVILTRIAVATLTLSDSLLDERDDAARKKILAEIQPEDVLNALLLGLARVRSSGSRRRSTNGGSARLSVSGSMLAQVTLERTLRALADNPELIRELRLLLPNDTDSEFARFRHDLESVLALSANGRR